MDKVETNIDYALRRIAGFINIMRWVWCANLLVVIIGIATRRYLPVAIAGPTWIFALTATAYAKRAAKHLETAKQAAIASSAPREQKQPSSLDVLDRAA